MKRPNDPAAGKAGVARLLAVGHHYPGLPERGRYLPGECQRMFSVVGCR